MKIFADKLKLLKQENTEVTTKHLRNALLNVLRSCENLMVDGHSSSSGGSDKAPSEDNLAPEEI